jgi:hypothetical protein
LRRDAEARSWLMNAVVNAGPREAAGAGHAWQTVDAPMLLYVLGRAHRRRRDGTRARVLMLAWLLAAALLIALWPQKADAQSRCSEGRTANGQCTNEALAAAARQTAIIHSQWRLSSTAYPLLPSTDYRHRYPHDLNPNPLQLSATGIPVPPPAPPTPLPPAPAPPPPPPPVIIN